MSLSLQHPFTAIIGGPTGCGKTYFVFRLIENAHQMIDPPPVKFGTVTASFNHCSDSIHGLNFTKGFQMFQGSMGDNPFSS